MSNIKKRVQVNKIRNQIFRLIQEYRILQELTPDYDPSITSPNNVSTEKDNALQTKINLADKYILGDVLDEVKKTEEKLKKYVLMMSYKETLERVNDNQLVSGQPKYSGLPSIVNIPSDISRIDFGLISSEEIYNSIVSGVELEDIPMSISLKIINEVISSIALKMVKTANGSDGGPLGTMGINISYKNIDYKSNVLSNDQSLESIFPIINSVFSSHSQSKVKKYKDGIKNKTDSWLTDSNHESWSSLIGYIYSEMSGRSYDSESFAMSMLNSLVTGDIPTIIADSEMFADENKSALINFANRAIYVGWTVAGYLSVIGGIGASAKTASDVGAAAGFWTKTATRIIIRRIFFVFAAAFCVELVIAGFRIFSEAHKYKSILSSVEKILSIVNNKVIEEVSSAKTLKDIVSDDLSVEEIVVNVTSNIFIGLESTMSNVSSKYDIAKQKRSKEIESLKKDLDQNATRYDGKYVRSYRDQSGKSYNANYGSQDFKNEFGESMWDYNKKIKENDVFSPRDVWVFKNYITSENKKGKELKDLSDIAYRYIQMYIATMAYDIIFPLKQEMDISIGYLSYNIDEYVKEFKRSIENNLLDVVSDDSYLKWETEISNLSSDLKDSIIPNNNTYSVSIESKK